MLNIKRFKPEKRICLTHYDNCYLIYVDLLQNICVEEYYDETYIAQHLISEDGETVKSVDENYGKTEITPFDIPANAILPNNPLEHPLNHSGMRFRGLREEEKVMEWIRPLSMIDKMPLLKALNLTVSPMMIFGIAESRVLSETEYSDSETIICRRIQLLQALPEIQIDEEGLPYDYETISFRVIQSYNRETEATTSLHDSLLHFSAIPRAMDCIYSEDRLVVSNSGNENNLAEVHIFQSQENEL